MMLQLLHIADKAGKQLTEIRLPTLLRYLAKFLDRKTLQNRTSCSDEVCEVELSPQRIRNVPAWPLEHSHKSLPC